MFEMNPSVIAERLEVSFGEWRRGLKFFCRFPPHLRPKLHFNDDGENLSNDFILNYSAPKSSIFFLFNTINFLKLIQHFRLRWMKNEDFEFRFEYKILPLKTLRNREEWMSKSCGWSLKSFFYLNLSVNWLRREWNNFHSHSNRIESSSFELLWWSFEFWFF